MAEIERLTVVWDANFQKLDEKLNKVIRSHYGAAAKIKKDADTFTRQLEEKYGRIGKAFGNVFNDSRLATIQAGSSHLRVFGSALEPLGVAGLAAAAGVAALAVASQQAIAAMKFADEIDDASQKLNIGTDALQEYRFAMTEFGGEAKDADTALASFSETLGLAQSGLSPKALKVFTSLGFSKETVDSWKTAEQALPAVADAIAGLNNETEKAAAAAKAGLGPMLPLLREGSAGFEEAAAKAHELGLVMDADLVRKGAEANQQFESLSKVIDVQLKTAFIELSDEVVAFTGYIADALKGLNDFLGKFSEWKNQVRAIYGDDFIKNVTSGDAGGMLQGIGASVDAITSGRAGNAQGILQQGGNFATAMPSAASLAALMAPPAAHGGGHDLIPVRTRGHADHSAEQRARRQEQFEKNLDRVQAELLRAYETEYMSIGEAAGIKLEQLNAEHAANLREITAQEQEYIQSKGLRGLSKAEADKLRALQNDLDDAKRAEVQARERHDLEAYRLKTAQEAAQSEIELLQIGAEMALTANQRWEAEKRILALTLQRERDQQKADLANDPNLDDSERAARLAQGDRGRQARYGAQDQQSPGAKMARDAVQGIRNPADDAQTHQDALDAIAEMEAQSVIDHQTAMEAKAQIDADYNERRLSGTRTMLDQLAGLQSSSNKTLAAIGKAAALAQATMDGFVAIQKAWASAPFPFNIPAVAVTTAVTGANIAAIAGTGFRSGGYTGDGPESAVAGPVHGKEYVFDAAATRRIGKPALDALRKGSPLIGSLSGASASLGQSGSGSGAIHFAPVIDARGADVAAVARLERMLVEQSQSFAANVKSVQDKRQRWRKGSGH